MWSVKSIDQKYLMIQLTLKRLVADVDISVWW